MPSKTKASQDAESHQAPTSLQELQQRVPEVPTLAQVVDRIGGRQH